MYHLRLGNLSFSVHNDAGRMVYEKALNPDAKVELYKAYSDHTHQMNISYGRLCIFDNTMFIEMDEENGGWFPAQFYKIPLTDDNIQTIKSSI